MELSGIITYMFARFPNELREDGRLGALEAEDVDVRRRLPVVTNVRPAGSLLTRNRRTHAKAYVRWVYFDQGTLDNGKASSVACQPANQAAATFPGTRLGPGKMDPMWWPLMSRLTSRSILRGLGDGLGAGPASAGPRTEAKVAVSSRAPAFILAGVEKEKVMV